MKTIKLISFALLFFFTTFQLHSQDMTVTLGTGGLFKIKDYSNNNYLTLSQSNDQVNLFRSLRLEITGNSPTTGVIFKGANRFIHDYKPLGVNGYNTFIGLNSGNFSMSGVNDEASYNTGVGTYVLTSLSSGFSNTALGYASLYLNTVGNRNTAVGFNSLRNNTAGYQNTAIGSHSLYNNNGVQNTAIGYNSGSIISEGYNLICIGYNSQPSYISISNEITLGDNRITYLRCNVQNISALSDERDKKNINDLSLGLDFITQLKPRQFNWDRREWYEDKTPDGSKMEEKLTAGFIAQELDELQNIQNAEWLNLVLKSNPERLEATPGNLLPVIVKAIQELKTENDKLKEKLNEFEQMQNYLVNEIEKLKSDESKFIKTSSK